MNKDENKNNNTKILLYTFIASFLILMLLKYALNYANKNNFFQKGGNQDLTDNLTIVADDIDIGILEN
jgi:NADH:ubiquinone oxidoreductase subunit 4 (subunit M)